MHAETQAVFPPDVVGGGDLVAYALESIRGGIVKGEFKPRERLVAGVLAKELNMSRTPVREALKLLAAKGYVSQTRNGAFVADHSREQVQALYEIREALECAAIELTCHRWTGDQMERAAGFCRQLGEAVQIRNPAEIVRLNSAFHHELYAASGNERLCALIDDYRDLFFDAKLARTYGADDWEVTNEQHRSLLEAVRRRDADAARRAVGQHLAKSKRAVIERL
jgi:DNA-binding GntR family transcriptional regulator